MMATAMQWDDVLKIVLPLMGVAVGAVIWVWRIMAAERALWVAAVETERRERIEAANIERDRRVALASEMAAFREQIAREMVTTEMLTRLEERIVDSINRLGDRMDRLIEGRPTTTS
jgi:hypothetical protein